MASESIVKSFPPIFGERRRMAFPPMQRFDFPGLDGSTLRLHHTSGGRRGPVILAPGTAMSALSYCIDTVRMNFVEYLVSEGFDVWLFDWRTSPELEAHEHPYTLDDVARYDWPAAIEQVHSRTGQPVSVLAHCLSAPTFMLSLVRDAVPREAVRAFVASQVALHLRLTTVGKLKLNLHLDKLLPGHDMIHQIPEDVRLELGDVSASMLARILPKSFSCDNRACYRHAATFGEIILHSRINPATHELMGELVPECLAAFLKDVAVRARHEHILTDEDLRRIDRLNFPILFVSGSENRMFVPRGTEESYDMLCDANGRANYRRTVYRGFGHLDFYLSEAAADAIWPDLSAALDP